MYELTLRQICLMNPEDGGRIKKKHALEMIRQGKARPGGRYFHDGREIHRLVMGGKMYRYCM